MEPLPNTDDNLQPLDQLNVLDLSKTDTSYPTLAEGLVRVTLQDLLIKPNKAGTGNVLHVKMALHSEAKLDNGQPAHPGLVFTETVSLVPTDNYDPTVNLAKIQLCFTGQKGKMDWNSLKGQWGDVRVKIDDHPDYGKRNRVGTWIAKSAESVAKQL